MFVHSVVAVAALGGVAYWDLVAIVDRQPSNATL
jgi:hypothetical protein